MTGLFPFPLRFNFLDRPRAFLLPGLRRSPPSPILSSGRTDPRRRCDVRSCLPPSARFLDGPGEGGGLGFFLLLGTGISEGPRRGGNPTQSSRRRGVVVAPFRGFVGAGGC